MDQNAASDPPALPSADAPAPSVCAVIFTVNTLIVAADMADRALALSALCAAGIHGEQECVPSLERLREALTRRAWSLIVVFDDRSHQENPYTLEALCRTTAGTPMVVVTDAAPSVPEGFIHCERVGRDALARLPAVLQQALDRTPPAGETCDIDAPGSQTEMRLNSILEALEDIIWSVELPRLRLAYLNPAAERIYGRPASDFLGDIGTWLDAVHPEDRERMRHYLGSPQKTENKAR